MRKAYVVSDVNYEYNDEYYYKSEAGGGTPKNVFFDEAAAKKERDRLQVEAARETIVGFRSRLSDWVNEDIWYESDLEALRELGFNPDEPREMEIPEDATDEFILKATDALNLNFFEVHEVPITE